MGNLARLYRTTVDDSPADHVEHYRARTEVERANRGADPPAFSDLGIAEKAAIRDDGWQTVQVKRCGRSWDHPALACHGLSAPRHAAVFPPTADAVSIRAERRTPGSVCLLMVTSRSPASAGSTSTPPVRQRGSRLCDESAGTWCASSILSTLTPGASGQLPLQVTFLHRLTEVPGDRMPRRTPQHQEGAAGVRVEVAPPLVWGASSPLRRSGGRIAAARRCPCSP